MTRPSKHLLEGDVCLSTVHLSTLDRVKYRIYIVDDTTIKFKIEDEICDKIGELLEMASSSVWPWQTRFFTWETERRGSKTMLSTRWARLKGVTVVSLIWSYQGLHPSPTPILCCCSISPLEDHCRQDHRLHRKITHDPMRFGSHLGMFGCIKCSHFCLAEGQQLVFR